MVEQFDRRVYALTNRVESYKRLVKTRDKKIAALQKENAELKKRVKLSESFVKYWQKHFSSCQK